ncbi:MAG: AsmA-like C-terminal domain-containing protein [Nitrospiraceae bacterium]
MRRILRFVVLSLVAGMLLAIASLFLVRSTTGRDYVKEFFVHQIEQNIGRRLEVGMVRIVLFPGIHLDLRDVTIYEPDGRQVFVTAQRIDTVLRLLPLLRRQVIGKRLVIEKPEITLRRTAPSSWNIATIASAAGTTSTGHKPGDWLMFVNETTVQQGTLRLIDEARPDGTRTMQLQDVTASFMVRPELQRAEVGLTARLQSDPGVASLSLTGTVGQTSPSVGFGLDNPRQTGPLYQFDGLMQADHLQIRQIADLLGPRPIPQELAGALNVQGRLRVVPGVSGYDMLFHEVTARLDKLALTGRASLAGVLSPQPTVSITFSASPVKLQDLVTYVPLRWIHPEIQAVLAEREVDGTVEVANATVTGSPDPNPQFGITGEFRIREGRALLGTDRVLTQHLTGTVFVDAGRIRIPAFSGDYGALHISQGKALVSFLDAGPWLELDLTGDMTAADLVGYLATSLRAPGVSRFLTSIRNIQGSAVPTFRLVGALNQPGGITFVGGEVRADDLSFDTPTVPQRVQHVTGLVRYSQSGTEFDAVAGQVGSTTFRVHGTVTAGATGAFQDLSIQTKGEIAELAPLMPGQVAQMTTRLMQGPVSLSIILSGPAEKPRLRAQAHLADALLRLPWIGEKPSGIPASVELEGELAPRGFTITQLDAVLPPTRIGVKGKLVFGRRFSIDVSLATGTVALSGLPEWLNRGGLEAGQVEVSLDVKGAQPDWSTWRTTGWIALTNGLMHLKGVDGPIQDLYARIRLVRDGAELKQLSFKLMDSDLSLSGLVRNWNTKPTMTAKIESSHLDLDLIIPKEGRSPIRDLLEYLAATSQVTATASIERGVYKQFRVGGLSGRINIDNGILDIDRVNARSEGGHLTGRLVVHLPKDDPAEAEASFRVAGVPFEEISHLLGVRDHFITGEMRLTGTLRGHGRNPHGMLPTLSGDAEVLVTDGRIFKSQKRALWKILSILNLPAVLQNQIDLEKDGLPFDRLTTSLVIQNGRLDSDRLVLDSPVVKISGAGHYDLPTDQLEMVYAVSPFGSYSKLVRTIPLFGRLFAGDRTGIATAFFQARGSMDDPEVTYLPMKSFGEGLSSLASLAYDVLRNTFKMPKDFIIGSGEAVPAPSSEIDAPSSVPDGNLY